MPKPGPFSGLKLSEQVNSPAAGLDQQLFAPRVEAQPVKPVAVSEPTKGPTEPTKEPSKEATLEARKEETLEPRNQGSAVKSELPRHSFDLNDKAYRQNTYAFTEGELNALEDIAIHIRRKLDLDVTKNDLIRCALHGLVDDFDRSGAASDLVRRLRHKRPR